MITSGFDKLLVVLIVNSYNNGHQIIDTASDGNGCQG